MMNKSTLLLLLGLAAFCMVCAVFAKESADNNANDKTQVNVAAGSEENAEQLALVLNIEADSEYGAYLAGECSTCHTPGGGDGSIPLIHAKSREYIASALLAYKNKQRASEVMRGVTAALTNEEIAALATYFSEQ